MPIFLNLNKKKINFKVNETIILQDKLQNQIAELKVKKLKI